MPHPPEEIRAAYRRYVATRDRIEAGELGWDALAEFFTEDAVFIDPAWGRVDGLPAITKFLSESMAGLDDWSFPEAWTMVEETELRPSRTSSQIPSFVRSVIATPTVAKSSTLRGVNLICAQAGRVGGGTWIWVNSSPDSMAV